MDSEIIEKMKPLLEDYLAFTRGKVPSDWVKVRDERQKSIERLQREIRDLEEGIKKREEFNANMEKNVIEALKRWKHPAAYDLEEEIKENREKNETDQKQIELFKEALNIDKEEFKEAKALIETRRQAGIAKIGKKIHNTIRQYIEEKEATGENQETIEALRRKYEKLSNEDIEKLAVIEEEKEKKQLKDTKIEVWKKALKRKEENCKDLLTEDYYVTKEEYIKSLENHTIEELEQITSITIATIYKQALQKTIKEHNMEKANSLFATIKKIEGREEIIRKNELVAEESNQKQKKDLKSDIQFEEEKSIGRRIQQGIKEKINKISKVKQTMHNIWIWLVNKSFGIKLLGDGEEGILMNDDQIHEIWKKNEAKRKQLLMEDIRQKSQSEQTMEMQDEKIKEKEEYRKANDIADKTAHAQQEDEFVAAGRLNKPLIIPDFLKNKGVESPRDNEILEENLYKQGLKVEISQEEQRKYIRLFQRKDKSRNGRNGRKTDEILIEG